jgi:tetratricopeptide (TPR) repeat protein
LDHIHYIEYEAITSHERAVLDIPHELPDIQIPEVGITVRTAVLAAQQYLKREPTLINGEIILDTGGFNIDPGGQQFQITLRASRGANTKVWGPISVKAENPMVLVTEVSESILEQQDPYILATYLFTSGKPDVDRASRIVEKMIDNKSDLKWAYLLRGLMLATQALAIHGSDKEAISYYEQSLHEDPKFANAHTDWGLLLMNEDDARGALYHFQKALQLNSKSRPAYSGLIGAMRKLGKKEDALDLIQLAMRRDRKNFVACEYLGLYYSIDGNDERAIPYFRMATEIDPAFDYAFYDWGKALLNLHQYDEAIHRLRQALDLNPEFDDAHYQWGLALDAQMKFRDAIDEYKRAIGINPKHTQAQHALTKDQEQLSSVR